MYLCTWWWAQGNACFIFFFLRILPKSIANGEILQVVVFSIIFGIAMVMVAEKITNSMLTFAN